MKVIEPIPLAWPKVCRIATPDEDLILRLYVSADTSRSQEAIRNLEAIRDAMLEGEAQIEVVDVNAEPHRAVEDRILATPTLYKLAPGPPRKVVGDLSDHAAALSKLGIPGRSS